LLEFSRGAVVIKVSLLYRFQGHLSAAFTEMSLFDVTVAENP
jgi:hypothetical protein